MESGKFQLSKNNYPPMGKEGNSIYPITHTKSGESEEFALSKIRAPQVAKTR